MLLPIECIPEADIIVDIWCVERRKFSENDDYDATDTDNDIVDDDVRFFLMKMISGKFVL